MRFWACYIDSMGKRVAHPALDRRERLELSMVCSGLSTGENLQEMERHFLQVIPSVILEKSWQEIILVLLPLLIWTSSTSGAIKNLMVMTAPWRTGTTNISNGEVSIYTTRPMH